LLDFWATWCISCRLELPNILETYAKYHDQGMDILGVSLDDNKTQLSRGIKELKIPWPQYCDEKGWTNTLVAQYGIFSLPANILVDQKGKVIAWNLTGPELPAAVAKALGK
jgi:thiol-disulfide isomerase/thioredoxin